MIRIGDTILNEAFIASVQPAYDEHTAVAAKTHTPTCVTLSSGAEVFVKASMPDVIRVLEQAGLVDSSGTVSTKTFTDDELEELRHRYSMGFRYAAKDGNGRVYAYSERPRKGEGSWINDDSSSTVFKLILGDYDALSFDDAAPLDLAELLDQMGSDA